MSGLCVVCVEGCGAEDVEAEVESLSVDVSFRGGWGGRKEGGPPRSSRSWRGKGLEADGSAALSRCRRFRGREGEMALVDRGAGLVVTTALGMLIAQGGLLLWRIVEGSPLILDIAEEVAEVFVEGCCVIKLPR